MNIFSKIKNYLRLSKELQEILSRDPDNVQKFQEIFNLTVDRVYQDIMDFEKTNVKRFESKVYRLRKIFEKRYRPYFLHGEYIKWSFEKPFGYAGDFKIIDDIYQNKPSTIAFDRLWDNYFQQLAVSKSVRRRKEDLKRIISDFVREHKKDRNFRIMNLAGGPAREVKELLESDTNDLFSGVIFDCYDFEIRALNYANKLLNGISNVNFYQRNAIRLALKKDIKSEIPYSYDLIYSAGLFDYLSGRVAIRLINSLKKLLKKNGMIIITSTSDKYNNPSAVWMEWVAEWYLVYRTMEEFKEIFLNAGFLPDNLQIVLQDSKIMQYCLAMVE